MVCLIASKKVQVPNKHFKVFDCSWETSVKDDALQSFPPVAAGVPLVPSGS